MLISRSCNPFLRCRDPAIVERVGCVPRTSEFTVLQELLKLRTATSQFWWIHADRHVWCHSNAHVRYHSFEIGAQNERKPGCCVKTCFLRRKNVPQPTVSLGAEMELTELERSRKEATPSTRDE